jgi:hypothetical protein
MTEEEIIMRAVESGRAAASRATQDCLDAHGHQDCCGFAWTTVLTDGRSRVGRALMKAGFKKVDGQKGLHMWNPSGHRTQSLTAKEHGAQAMAQELSTRLGVKASAHSRMD